MSIYSIYKDYREFYRELEVDFAGLMFEQYEWESLHLRYLLYYMTRYDIQTEECFTAYHYRVSYRLYLMNFLNSVTI